MSLKKELNELINSKGQVSHAEVENFCKLHGYRVSNAERRLRPSESPDIISIYKDGVVVAYKSGKVERFVEEWQKKWQPTKELSALF